MSLLYEGKAKRIFLRHNQMYFELNIRMKSQLVMVQKDFIEGKGRLNNQITSRIFSLIQDRDINSHFIEQLSETEQLVKSVDIIPLEVVVRNIAAGSITKRLGFDKGHKFESPLVEFFYKNDDLNDPLITEDHIQLLNIASKDEIEKLKDAAITINSVLLELMDDMDLRLVDFKIEFGRSTNGQILLADEISPDTCRIWDKYSDTNFDKDVYREDTGSIIDTYQTFLNKLEEL